MPRRCRSGRVLSGLSIHTSTSSCRASSQAWLTPDVADDLVALDGHDRRAGEPAVDHLRPQVADALVRPEGRGHHLVDGAVVARVASRRTNPTVRLTSSSLEVAPWGRRSDHTSTLGETLVPVAVITGASLGLGRALAHALAETGWSLVLDARHPEPLARATADLPGGPHRVLAGDVTDPAHRADLVAAAARPGWRGPARQQRQHAGAQPAAGVRRPGPHDVRPHPRGRRGGPDGPGRRAPPPAAGAGRSGAQHLLGRRGRALRDLGRLRLRQGGPRPREPGAGRRGAGVARVRRRPRRHADRDAPGRLPGRGHQ